MCGIFSVVNEHGLRNSKEEFKAALRRLAHRGPDNEGIFQDERVFLGHRRLSIIDTSPAGDQPMSSADGMVVIVFNGQIYNFKAIKKNLERKGHKFETNSDTEVLLNAYIDKGLGLKRRKSTAFECAESIFDTLNAPGGHLKG